MALNILVFVLAFLIMESIAWFTHKYIMHGFLWRLHKSHHQLQKGFELNDLFGIFFACLAILLIWFGLNGIIILFWAGLGITAYGFAYFIFHDILVHRRLNHNLKFNHPYFKRIIKAHKIHHKNQKRDGSKYFGFLFVKKNKDLI